jgi:Ca2+-binding RTX toxin-like protein
VFAIFRDFLATRLIAQFDTLVFALSNLTRSNTLVLPDDSATREDVTISTYGNTLYTSPAGADVTLTGDATLFRLGGDGQATIQTMDADSRVYGNDADNIFLGNGSRDVFYGGSGADQMDGGAGNDVLYGGGGDDRLIVGTGRDRAYGGAGDDVLIAAGGQSRLYGGAGDDTYRLDASGDDLHIIYDFDAGDQVVITGQGDIDSLADITAAGGRVYQSKANTIIKLGDAQIQLRDFALTGLTDAMINSDAPMVPAPPEPPATDPDSDAEFATIAAFLASDQASTLSEVTIAGRLYRLRDSDPVHQGYKFTDTAGRFWSQDYFVVVSAGQSNMVGSGAGGDLTLNPNVAAYDWVNDEIILSAYDAAPAGGAARTGSTIRNNLYIPMANQLSNELDRPVLIVSHAVSGSRIDTWLESGTGENWAELNPEVALALAHVGQDQADAFIWHQGESDYPVPTAEYKADALELVAQVRAQGWAGDALPFLFGELSRDGVNFAQNRALQEIELENTDPKIGFVSSAGLISDELSGVHFNGAALNLFGARYFETLMNILEGVIAPANSAPEVNTAAAIPVSLTIAEGQEIRLDVSDYFTDAEGDELFYYAYLNKRNTYLARADQDSDEMVITPSFDHAGTYRLFIYANDYDLDGEVVEIDLTVTEATPLVTLYNNRTFDAATLSYRDFDTGIAALDRNRGLEILDQAAFGGDTTRLLSVDTAHIRGDAGIFAQFTIADGIRQSYYYGDAAFDVIGNAEDNYIVGADGGSTMSGGEGRDRLFGNGGDDRLFGNTGDDQLFGGAGADLIDGGLGKDQATGGAGADVFVFEAGDTQLYLRDFEAGVDVVQVSGFAGINDFDDLVDAALLRDSNGRALVDIGSDRIMFDNTAISDLSADYFAFV